MAKWWRACHFKAVLTQIYYSHLPALYVKIRFLSLSFFSLSTWKKQREKGLVVHFIINSDVRFIFDETYVYFNHRCISSFVSRVNKTLRINILYFKAHLFAKTSKHSACVCLQKYTKLLSSTVCEVIPQLKTFSQDRFSTKYANTKSKGGGITTFIK